MRLKSLITKIIPLGLPLIIVPIARAIFGKGIVNKILIYTVPVLLIPLLIKIFLKIKRRKK